MAGPFCRFELAGRKPGLRRIIEVRTFSITTGENMVKIIEAWYHFWGRVWVPPALRHLPEPVILHLSDTPTSFFNALPALIRQVNPTWIIHTGDLVDDIKLGLNPRHMNHYAAKVQKLIRILELSEAEVVFLCLGNHDDLKALGEFSHRIRILSAGQQLTLGTLTLGVSHYAEEALAAGGEICLFGHSLARNTDLSGNPRLLNGLEAIHLIRPLSGQVHCLRYPSGTDDQRLGRGKVGL